VRSSFLPLSHLELGRLPTGRSRQAVGPLAPRTTINFPPEAEICLSCWGALSLVRKRLAGRDVMLRKTMIACSQFLPRIGMLAARASLRPAVAVVAFGAGGGFPRRRVRWRRLPRGGVFGGGVFHSSRHRRRRVFPMRRFFRLSTFFASGGFRSRAFAADGFSPRPPVRGRAFDDYYEANYGYPYYDYGYYTTTPTHCDGGGCALQRRTYTVMAGVSDRSKGCVLIPCPPCLPRAALPGRRMASPYEVDTLAP